MCTDIDATRERQSFDEQIVGEYSNKRHHYIHDCHVENYHRNRVFGLEVIDSHDKTTKKKRNYNIAQFLQNFFFTFVIR